jgi:repressor LexA
VLSKDSKAQCEVLNIEVVDQGFNSSMSGIELPIVGYIAAGQPIDAIENPVDTVMVASDMVSKSKRCYVLQVRGDSMIQDGIFDEDYVVIQSQETAHDGEIIVALIDDSFATLKKLYHEKDGRIRLQPANDKMDPIYVHPAQLKIQGKVTGVIRRFN